MKETYFYIDSYIVFLKRFKENNKKRISKIIEKILQFYICKFR